MGEVGILAPCREELDARIDPGKLHRAQRPCSQLTLDDAPRLHRNTQTRLYSALYALQITEVEDFGQHDTFCPKALLHNSARSGATGGKNISFADKILDMKPCLGRPRMRARHNN